MSPTPPPPAQNKQRSREGCVTCRLRRVKCDETKPVCKKCQVKGRECSWIQSETVVYASPIRDTRTISNDRDPDTTREAKKPRSSVPDPLALLQTPGASSSKHPLCPSAAAHGENVHMQDHAGASADGARYLSPKSASSSPKRPRGSILPKYRAEMMADPAFLEPYFPSVEDRLLMRHYLLNGVQSSMANHDGKRYWNPWAELVAPLALTNASTMVLPEHTRQPIAGRQGLKSSHSTHTPHLREALKLGMLAISAIVLRYKHDPCDGTGAARLYNDYWAHAMAYLGKAEAEMLSHEGDQDLVLLVHILFLVSGALAAQQDTYTQLFHPISQYLSSFGGLSALSRRADRDAFSLPRFIMEQLIFRNIYGFLVSDIPAPVLLQEEDVKDFEEAVGWSRRNEDWESFERMFGLSRRMALLVLQYVHLIRSLPSTTSYSRETDFPALTSRANALLQELQGDQGRGLLQQAPQQFRARFGDLSYQYTLTMSILTKVFGVGYDDPRVVRAVDSVLELGQEVVAGSARVIWMGWPLMTACLHMVPFDNRAETGRALLAEYAHHGCFDNRNSLNQVIAAQKAWGR